jgi:hypothetical protein
MRSRASSAAWMTSNVTITSTGNNAASSTVD